MLRKHFSGPFLDHRLELPGIIHPLPSSVMPLSKRKRTKNVDDDASFSASSLSEHERFDEDDIDISSALTGKRPKLDLDAQEEEEELADFIQKSIAKRSMKEGVQVMKNTKGKAKLTKGETGGGSFQSMG